MKQLKPSRPFGLVAGLGVGAGIFYYKSIVDTLLSRGVSGSLTMVHADVRKVMAQAAAREVEELAGYLAGLIRQLEQAGAQMATIPAFAPQVCARELAALTPIPLISLLDVVAGEVKRLGLRRVAVFGSRVAMETNLFGSLTDTEVIKPSPGELEMVADIYVHIVESGAATEKEYEQLRTLAHTLINREGLDTIILAGTDLAFVFNPSNTDFAHVDGARLHIETIVQAMLPL